MNKAHDIATLNALAHRLRTHSVRMLAAAGSGHLGGCLSSADLLATLYGAVLNVRAEEPEWEARDRFVLSIGHIAPVYYATLAERGFFPVEGLQTLRALGSPLQGHPARIHGPKGVDTASGSLGQGLSLGVGFALAARLKGLDYHSYVLLGDGELQEGQIWEAAMTAAHYKLSNLTALVDWNGVQIDGQTAEVMCLEPLAEKWRAFGWEVLEVDGHSIGALLDAFDTRKSHQKPRVLLSRTQMGRGIKSITGDYRWHGKAPNAEEAKRFLKELDEYNGSI